MVNIQLSWVWIKHINLVSDRHQIVGLQSHPAHALKITEFWIMLAMPSTNSVNLGNNNDDGSWRNVNPAELNLCRNMETSEARLDFIIKSN